MSDDLDEVLDSLPRGLRNRVLNHLESSPAPVVEHNGSRYLKTKLLFAILLAIPTTAVGILLCLTIIGIPFGLVTMGLGCAPLFLLFRGKIIDPMAEAMVDREP